MLRETKALAPWGKREAAGAAPAQVPLWEWVKDETARQPRVCLCEQGRSRAGGTLQHH